jgi:hypothetical protein
MYKAIKEIGGYKIGDEVPKDKAIAWLGMYKVPHVEEVLNESTDKVEELKVEEVKEESSNGSSILEDYLARGSNVVKKNIAEDEFSEDQLQELLILEKSNKNRYAIVKEIEKRLSN